MLLPVAYVRRLATRTLVIEYDWLCAGQAFPYLAVPPSRLLSLPPVSPCIRASLQRDRSTPWPRCLRESGCTSHPSSVWTERPRPSSCMVLLGSKGQAEQLYIAAHAVTHQEQRAPRPMVVRESEANNTGRGAGITKASTTSESTAPHGSQRVRSQQYSVSASPLSTTSDVLTLA